MKKNYEVLQGVSSKSGSGNLEILKSFKNLEEAREFYNVAKFDIEGYDLKNKILITVLADDEGKILEDFDLDLFNIKIDVDAFQEMIVLKIFDEDIKLMINDKDLTDINDIEDLIKENNDKFDVFGNCKELIKIKALKAIDDYIN